MKFLQKLVRNGNCTQVTIPRPILTHIGWSTGSWVIVELREDNGLIVRLPSPDDLQPRGMFPPAPADAPVVAR